MSQAQKPSQPSTQGVATMRQPRPKLYSETQKRLCLNCQTYDDGEGIVAFCPLHKAAPALLEALKAVLDEHSDCTGCASSNQALATIAAAEGRGA